MLRISLSQLQGLQQSKGDCCKGAAEQVWLVIKDKLYDVTGFLHEVFPPGH